MTLACSARAPADELRHCRALVEAGAVAGGGDASAPVAAGACGTVAT